MNSTNNGYDNQKNDVINTHNLNQDIDWINRNPFRTATVIASPGDEQGTTKLIIKAREKKPVRVYTGFNNTGSQSTTEDRALVGVNWGAMLLALGIN